MANWLITGVSSGFGRALAEAVLAKGDTVAGTVRNEAAKSEFEKLAPGKAVGIRLDVTDQASVRRGVEEAEKKTGGIDVLVNNAGYGLEGAVEEVTLEQIRSQFEVNVFGAVSVIQAALPYMRKRRAGHIVNITSMGGLTAFPGVGIYNGSKFALEGISEALAKEVKPLGIKVIIVAPGSFRTDWAGRSMVHVDGPIADYEATAGSIPQIVGASQWPSGGRSAESRGSNHHRCRILRPSAAPSPRSGRIAICRRKAWSAAGRNPQVGPGFWPPQISAMREWVRSHGRKRPANT